MPGSKPWRSSILTWWRWCGSCLGAIADLPWAQERPLKLKSALPEAWIKGDTDKLKQVFINLIRTACEAVETSNTIT